MGMQNLQMALLSVYIGLKATSMPEFLKEWLQFWGNVDSSILRNFEHNARISSGRRMTLHAAATTFSTTSPTSSMFLLFSRLFVKVAGIKSYSFPSSIVS